MGIYPCGTRILALRDNFFKINVTQIKQDLENLPWIRDVTVKKTFLPNILQISIKEKDVLAIWQLNKKFYPLDMEGYVIEADYKATKPSLLIIGEEAPENINNLLKAYMCVEITYMYIPMCFITAERED